MLEMSVPELEDAVRRELDENPALEVSANAGSADDDGHDVAAFDETSEQLQLADFADRDEIPDSMYRRSSRLDSTDFVDAPSFAADESDSLIDVLMQRLSADVSLSDTDAVIARNIIGNIDGNGYLTRPIGVIADDIALTEGFEPSADDMKRIYAEIRKLDPPGIGAVDLRDCLLLQLRRLDLTDDVAQALRIVTDYFDLFSKRHFDRLTAATGLDKERLAAALEVIRTLNPKPASALDIDRSNDRARHISPDASIDYDADSDVFTVTLMGNIPELAVEQSFAAAVESPLPVSDSSGAKARQKQAQAFVRRRYDDANAFIQLIKMRDKTLMAVLRAIAVLQKPFFESGEKASIRPMVLRDVAARTGYDLSVISRATAGKYILTQYGIFPIKMFFNERPDADTDVSTHRILDVLASIIANEDKHNPLSDRDLCEAMAARGYDIARRTIAKYRERLGAPVARLRKQL